uniref:Semaphorin-1A n=1 Tax=Strigamia maritima TaxID=126957 RepID=T1IUH4_STRMM
MWWFVRGLVVVVRWGLTSSRVAFSATLLIHVLSTTCAIWQEDAQPHSYVILADYEVKRFYGNKSHFDYFKLLERDGESLLVGARNIVYNISLHNLTENKPLEWYSMDAHVNLCQLKGKFEDDCQNYIRVLLKHDNGLFICGTNAYKPMCRNYQYEDDEYKFKKDLPGQGSCPYDPNHNSTAIYADGELYVATVADFSANDALIYREPLRTAQFDPNYLNVPNFVSSLTVGDFVFFFFRETAIEYINCGKTVYSRVARVCKRDQGGPNKFRSHWTSFLKARLNCSVGGEFPFYFNEIQSTSEVVEGVYGGKKAQLVYGVFTTPLNSISGSAVCAFRLQDILGTFDGAFKEQEGMNFNWLPVVPNRVPEPRPGQCVNDSRTLPDVPLNFIKSHTLMDQAVPAFWGHPIAIKTSLKSRFTQIAVDPQVKTPDGKTYDVLFIGTNSGKVLKAINAESPSIDKTVNTVIIEEIQVFAKNVTITNLKVYRSVDPETGLEEGQLIVVSDNEILSIKLQRCYTNRITSCSECVALKDPYCAWDEKNQKCTSAGSPKWSAGQSFLQNVALGYHARCPDGECAFNTPQRSPHQNPGRPGRRNDLMGNTIPTSLAETDHKGPVFGASRDSEHIYTAETLALAVGTSIVASLLLGFITGYFFRQRCQSDEVDTSYGGDPYLEQQRRSMPRMSHEASAPPLMNHSDAFLPPSSNNKTINLVLNVNPKNGKNANSSADNKPVQKVKKIYL